MSLSSRVEEIFPAINTDFQVEYVTGHICEQLTGNLQKNKIMKPIPSFHIKYCHASSEKFTLVVFYTRKGLEKT